MAQLSRPYQIALAATVFLALVWFVALRPHSTSSSSTPVASTPVSTPAPVAAAKAKAPAGTTHIEGMTRAVTHAHEAVAASQRTADKSASASAEAPSQGTTVAASSTTVTQAKQAGTAGSGAAGTTKSTTKTTKSTAVIHTKHAVPAGTVTKSSVTVTKSSKHGAPSSTVTVTKTSAHAAPAQQVAVEKQLKQGKVVLVLFWNPKGSDDEAVHKELQAVEKQLGGKVAVHYALAKQVSSYGSITKAIQVYQTPTILLVNGKGLTTTLTGFTDAFSIEQTVTEARQA